MTSVLVVTGGPDHAHDFRSSSDALAQVLAATGAQVRIVDHPDAVNDLLPGQFDALVVNALRWQMLHDRYDHLRGDWGYRTPVTTRDTIRSFVAAGGGLLGNHTASICFDDWPEWGAILGGAWDWERSSHPPCGPVTARLASAEAASHPVVQGLTELSLIDEVYGDVRLDPAAQVLMTARRTPDDTEQPVVWSHRYQAGRVVYDGFGHDAASLLDPRHQVLLQQALRWITEPH
ncbi:MAG: hypothetical protein RI958_664 [Actinomycetota bacterium]